MNYRSRAVSLLLSLLLLLTGLSGCGKEPDSAEPASSEPVSTEARNTAPSETERPPMPENGVSWRELFLDKQLPEGGYLAEDEAAFYVLDKNGSAEVTVMRIDELYSFVEGLGPLPRTRYYQDMQDGSFDLLYAAFDAALELGAEQFCFATDSLRGWDAAEQIQQLQYSFALSFSDVHFSCTKEYTASDGSRFHYFTASFGSFDYSHMRNYRKAMKEARAIVAGMDPGLDELGKAKYLYEYVARHVNYCRDDYYEQDDPNYLYDALIKRSAVCTGYAEALYTLFNLAGIDCLKVRGYAKVLGIPEEHAWNLAKVNGSWYAFDATWDSTVYLPLYFGLSDEAMDYYGERWYFEDDDLKAPACESILDPDYLTSVPPD